MLTSHFLRYGAVGKKTRILNYHEGNEEDDSGGLVYKTHGGMVMIEEIIPK